MEQTVYNRIETRDERCDLGIRHKVTYFGVKRITLAPDEFYDEWFDYLYYTHGGTGTIQVAYDIQGRRYERKPHWDGYTNWKRMEDGEIFFDRPSSRPAKDVYGRVI